MRRLTIRNIDETVYRGLEDRARRARRSLAAEIRAILEEVLARERSEIARRAAAMRARLSGRYTGNATAEIRADRGR